MNVHLIVSGHVQGVGFRFTSQQYAREYGLTGWVQNQHDGTVELELEGPKSKVDGFISLLKKGFNRSISVEHVKIDESTDQKNYKDFSIK